MDAGTGREVEIKLRAPSAAEGRRMLEEAGFSVSRRRAFESNVLYDTAERGLRRSRRLLRIREVDGECLLTYKGTPEGGPHKSREELEVKFERAGVLESILQRLGYHPVFRYEKYRTEFARPGGGGLATLDETPIGVYLELEGEPAWIDEAARELGFEQRDYILSSYASLYFDHCAAAGIGPAEGMVFEGSSGGNPTSPR